MPKTRFDAFRKSSPPPIDWLWAAVLERKARFGYDLKDMAAIANVKYETMRKYIRMSPWKWDDGAREAVVKEFGIKIVRSVNGAPVDDWV